MKKLLKNKVALLIVGALIVGFGGTFAYLSVTDSSQKKEQNQEKTNKDQGTTTQSQKGEGLPTQEKTTQPPPVQEQPPTGSSASLDTLSASVTAQKDPSNNSISVLFYLEGAGVFTAQEKSGSSWVTVKENQSYGGSGGFLAGSLSAGEDSKTYRVLKIENGKYTAATKEFTVTRSEVDAALGIKTYN